jgi:hypothetical protein
MTKGDAFGGWLIEKPSTVSNTLADGGDTQRSDWNVERHAL